LPETSPGKTSSSGEIIDLEDVAHNAHNNASGLVFPDQVNCKLHLTFDGSELPTTPPFEVRLNETSTYQAIETRAHSYLIENTGQGRVKRQINFTYGTCTIIVGNEVYKAGLSLTSPEDWKGICQKIITYCLSITEERRPRIELHIQRGYLSNRIRAESEDSFAVIKQTDIHNLMIRTLDGKKYIPNTTLLGAISLETIREFVMQDNRLQMDDIEKGNFINEIYRTSRILFALFVHAELKMQCLKNLMDNGFDDSDLPLPQDRTCHRRCEPRFDNLLTNQGGFIPARFDNKGKHQWLHPSIVIPIHYHAKAHGAQSSANTVRAHDKKVKAFNEEVTDKMAACCGQGASSNVYRVRIHPFQHNLMDVSRKL